jgi:hypothetical protein
MGDHRSSLLKLSAITFNNEVALLKDGAARLLDLTGAVTYIPVYTHGGDDV